MLLRWCIRSTVTLYEGIFNILFHAVGGDSTHQSFHLFPMETNKATTVPYCLIFCLYIFPFRLWSEGIFLSDTFELLFYILSQLWSLQLFISSVNIFCWQQKWKSCGEAVFAIFHRNVVRALNKREMTRRKLCCQLLVECCRRAKGSMHDQRSDKASFTRPAPFSRKICSRWKLHVLGNFFLLENSQEQDQSTLHKFSCTLDLYRCAFVPARLRDGRNNWKCPNFVSFRGVYRNIIVEIEEDREPRTNAHTLRDDFTRWEKFHRGGAKNRSRHQTFRIKTELPSLGDLAGVKLFSITGKMFSITTKNAENRPRVSIHWIY